MKTPKLSKEREEILLKRYKRSRILNEATKQVQQLMDADPDLRHFKTRLYWKTERIEDRD